MGGKGSGRSPRSHANLPKDDRNPAVATRMENVDPGVNSRIMRFGKRLMAFEEPAWDDEDALMRRFYDYLDLCDEFGIRPMVNSMAQAFGMNRQALWGVCTGSEHYRKWKGVTPACVNVLKKAYDFLQTSWEIYLTEEKGNPVKWFFLAKNYFGYEDQTVRVQRVEVNQTSLPSPEEVAAKYARQLGRQPEVIEIEGAEVATLPPAQDD
ncbi:hypothetical protein [Adlercreutzia sp. ZJ242]|uniref:hypothetical protein n=1 Tax=Adlercreutzia sp. ZJ242 TaxID=2709409 RepID=UPI0013EC658D|nr:hypothetical protein [Adlercreutzia sp. ZJ242]